MHWHGTTAVCLEPAPKKPFACIGQPVIGQQLHLAPGKRMWLRRILQTQSDRQSVCQQKREQSLVQCWVCSLRHAAKVLDLVCTQVRNSAAATVTAVYNKKALESIVKAAGDRAKTWSDTHHKGIILAIALGEPELYSLTCEHAHITYVHALT